jgi:hypothetical protein
MELENMNIVIMGIRISMAHKTRNFLYFWMYRMTSPIHASTIKTPFLLSRPRKSKIVIPLTPPAGSAPEICDKKSKPLAMKEYEKNEIIIIVGNRHHLRASLL